MSRQLCDDPACPFVNAYARHVHRGRDSGAQVREAAMVMALLKARYPPSIEYRIAEIDLLNDGRWN